MACQLSNDGEQVKVSITGPAEKLAVVMTCPKGEKKDIIIEKEQMITNSSSVSFKILDYNREEIQPGIYSFVLKRFDPEKKLEEIKLPLILKKVEIKDFKIGFKKNNQKDSLVIKSITFLIEKNGNCPVIFNGFEIFVNGIQCDIIGADDIIVTQSTDSIMLELCCPISQRKRQEHVARMERQSAFSLGLRPPPLTSEFRVGERCAIKGWICYGDRHGDNKKLEFVGKITFTSENWKNASDY